MDIFSKCCSRNVWETRGYVHCVDAISTAGVSLHFTNEYFCTFKMLEHEHPQMILPEILAEPCCHTEVFFRRRVTTKMAPLNRCDALEICVCTVAAVVGTMLIKSPLMEPRGHMIK